MAAESRRQDLNAQLDIEQILLEAQQRWLRPAEICEILMNYQKFRIAPEPPNRPPSGSLFLYDRKVLRYFRKDGHNWRKKKDGKTIKEAHEKLKSGSIDMLHCYYAHGEENQNFQRRVYWLLEEERSNIVLVHYREVQGNRMNSSRVREPQSAIPALQQSEKDGCSSEVGSAASSKFHPYDYQVTSHVSGTTSLNSTQASEYEDAESVYSQQSTSGVHSFTDFQSNMIQKAEDGISAPYYPPPFSNDQQGYFPAISGINFPSITHGNQNRNTANAYMPSGVDDFLSWDYQQFQPSISSTQSVAINTTSGQGSSMVGFINDLSIKQELENHFNALEEWQTSKGDSLQSSKWSVDQKMEPHQTFDFTSNFDKEKHAEFHDSLEAYNILHTAEDKHPMQDGTHMQLSGADIGSFLKAGSDGSVNVDGKTDHLALKQPLLGGVLRQGLTKLDSFDRWISKELEDVNEPNMTSSSQSYWENVGNEDGVDESAIASQVQLDPYVLSPSLSQDQLFSIIDFSPTWAYAGKEIKVLITGRFLKPYQEVEKYNWACMFGELEVPAELIGDGVLRCHTPFQKAGRVPFYVTCSNRLACSEVREFEFRLSEVQNVSIGSENSSSTSSESLLFMRLVKMVSLGRISSQNSMPRNVDDISLINSNICSLLREDCEWQSMMHLSSEATNLSEQVKDSNVMLKFLKDNLYRWLLQKISEGGKGANVLDEGGQGVLHFAAALGYDWVVPSILAARVNVNFRDVNGWTALHWAAHYGRERMVGCLISLGADPGALSDPTPQHPSGITPADLASNSGHKGIAGYLAESALSTHLNLLKLKDENAEVSGSKAVQMVSERIATPVGNGDWPYELSMKDSLAAVRNATQAAARIHQVYRVESFQRKQIKEYGGGGGEFGLPDERALSLLAVKNRTGHDDEPSHAAAIRIQNKYRSYKGRKQFLQIRQQIIKIQAHVRGHQVRKSYGKIIWSVGILEKVILRWRRKGSGLRGFKPETITESSSSSMQDQPVQEDDYDFLKQGRKQTEERLQKALARVKSMVQYPEARDQYRRLLNVVSEMRETKKEYLGDLSTAGELPDVDEDLIEIDLDMLFDEDTYMSFEQ